MAVKNAKWSLLFALLMEKKRLFLSNGLVTNLFIVVSVTDVNALDSEIVTIPPRDGPAKLPIAATDPLGNQYFSRVVGGDNSPSLLEVLEEIQRVLIGVIARAGLHYQKAYYNIINR